MIFRHFTSYKIVFHWWDDCIGSPRVGLFVVLDFYIFVFFLMQENTVNCNTGLVSSFKEFKIYKGWKFINWTWSTCTEFLVWTELASASWLFCSWVSWVSWVSWISWISCSSFFLCSSHWLLTPTQSKAHPTLAHPSQLVLELCCCRAAGTGFSYIVISSSMLHELQT